MFFTASCKVFISGQSKLTPYLNPSLYLCLWPPSFSGHFPSHIAEVISGLRVCNVVNMCTNFLGKSLALNLLVYSHDSSVLGIILWFCYGNGVGRFSLNSAPSLNVCNVTFLVDPRVCGPGTALFSERPREHAVCASSVSFLLAILENYCKMEVLVNRLTKPVGEISFQR